MPGKYVTSYLKNAFWPNPMSTADNFLLGLTYAIGLCKGFKRFAYFRETAWVSGKQLSYKNVFWGCQLNIAPPVSG